MDKSGISLIWSFRNRFEVFKKSILSAHKTSNLSLDFVLIDGNSSEETIRELRNLTNSIQNRKIRICESAYRTTCAEAWNLGIGLSNTRYVIITSSDCMFLKEGWLEAIKKSFEKGETYVLINNHSVFGLDKKMIAEVGWLDENLISAHGDVDLMIRTSEKGFHVGNIPNAGFYHHEDSPEATILRRKSLAEERSDPSKSNDDEYFKRKWKTSWPGWKDYLHQNGPLPHPPTHISQVQRQIAEIDLYPMKTKILKEQFQC